ncbi:MAG TPA: DNA internalization-related competence protein ComEC/Rec2 [Burkholderiaceae bacterium]
MSTPASVGPGVARRPGVWPGAVAAGWIMGSAWQLQQASLLDAPVYMAFVAMASVFAALFAIKNAASMVPPWMRVALLVLAGMLAGHGTVGLRALAFAGQALAPALEGRDLRVQGMVAAMPQRNEGGVRFRFDVESATLQGAAVAVPPRLQLGWYGGGWGAGVVGEAEPAPPALRAGERWQFTVRLKAPHGNSNPHGFDYELWLWEQGIAATGYVRTGPRDPPPQRLEGSTRHPIEQARQAVRDAIGLAVADARLAGVVAALVTGDQNAIDRADWDVYRATGVAHLMSISGLHITLFAWLAAAGIGALWRRSGRLCLALPAPSAGLLGGLLLATGYALFSGWGVPAQRTIWMLLATSLLRLSGVRWPWPAVCLLAMAVVVMLDPWALLQAGFWLSFVAVAVLFAAAPGDGPAPAHRKGKHPAPGWAAAASGAGSRLAALVREQWVVSLALTPLSLLLFGQVSVVGLLANLLAIPWVTLLVTPLALLGVLYAPLWQLAATAMGWLGRVLEALAALPFATVSVAAAPLWAGVAGVLGGVLLAMRLPPALRVLGVPLLLPVLLWQPVRPAPGDFSVLAADIGQGNAVLVQTAGHALLYDSGPRFSRDSDAGHRVLVPLLRAQDVRLDLLLLSHRDSDHTGGAAAVLAMQPRAGLLAALEESHPLWAQRPGSRCAAGMHWRWDGVDFTVLHPQPADYAAATKSNALSCVLRVAGAGRVVLLAGDIEAAQEARLLAAGAPLQADLLLVPHHGSKTSSTPAFVQAVQPRLAVVQAGYRNRFGHPAPEVLARYQAHGSTVLDSAHCGALLWHSADGGVRCQRDAAPRYWHHRMLVNCSDRPGTC